MQLDRKRNRKKKEEKNEKEGKKVRERALNLTEETIGAECSFDISETIGSAAPREL